jgi:hypothetical protein
MVPNNVANQCHQAWQTTDLHMWLDGEGPRANPVPPVNVIAALLGAAFGRGTRYVGTVVLTGGADRQGNPRGLSDERLGGLLGHLEQLGTGVGDAGRA